MKRLSSIFLLLVCVTLHSQSVHAQTRIWKQVTGGWSAAAANMQAAPNGDLYAAIYGDEASTEVRLFKSIDHGGSWQRVTSLPNCKLPLLALAIASDGSIYLSTGAPYGSEVNDPAARVYRSRDNGSTWTAILSGKRIERIAITSTGNSYFFEGYNVVHPDGAHLLTSSDDWVTWRPVALNLKGGYLTSLAPLGDKLILCTGYNKPWILNSFNSLTEPYFNQGLSTNYTLFNISSSQVAMASPADLLVSSNARQWIDDSGMLIANWPSLGEGTLTVDGKGSIFRLTSTLASTNDNGKTWNYHPDEFPRFMYPYTLMCDSLGAMYISDDQGIHRTTDGGASWTKASIPAVEVTTVGVSDNGTILVKPGSYSPLYYSTDETQSWKLSVLPDSTYNSDDFFTTSPSSNPLVTEYGGGYAGPCRLFELTGKHEWEALTALQPDGFRPYFCQTDSKANIYLGNGYISHDRGISWDRTPYPGTVSWPGFTATSDGYVFEASSQPVLYRTSDAGLSWTKLYLGVTGEAAVALASAPGGIIIAATDHHHVLRSNNNGATFFSWDNGFNDSATAMVITQKAEVYIAGNAGLHYCKLSDSQWQDVDLGVPNKEVHTVVVHNSNDVLVSTGADGVFISRDAERSVEMSTSVEELSSNYPNPFNGVTQFGIVLPTREKVTLEIVNEIGQQVALLENGTMDAGRHAFSFSNASVGGIYFAVLHTPSGVKTIKMSAAR